MRRLSPQLVQRRSPIPAFLELVQPAGSFLLCLTALNMAPPLLAQPPKCEDRQEVLVLVTHLGDAEFAVREAATRDLILAGPSVIAPLLQAAKGEDLEVTARAVAVLQQLHVEADRETSGMAGQALRDLTASTLHRDSALRRMRSACA
jgi:hypothetical protein